VRPLRAHHSQDHGRGARFRSDRLQRLPPARGILKACAVSLLEWPVDAIPLVLAETNSIL
jgi:hypothetical protein